MAARSGRNLCRACGLTFGSLGAFDMHRTGGYGGPIYKKSSTGKSETIIGRTKHTRRCLTVEEIQAKGMTQNEKGWWLANNFKMNKNDEAEDTEQEEDELEEA